METSFLPWKDEFAVGHEGLDAEHRHLVDAINEINTAERAGQTPHQMNAMVGCLKRLAEEHFQHENSVLNKINSSPLPSTGDRQAFLGAMVEASVSEHLISHRRSLARLNKIIRNLHSALNPVKQSFSQDLKAWFLDHMNNLDVRLKAVFKTAPNQIA